MDHPLQCRCGTLRGHLVFPPMTGSAVCYCRDCQAFAHFLGKAPDVLDANGGTEIVAMLPHRVAFASGLDALACMSLSPRGLLRWYAQCCNTPIANTPRAPSLPYVGVLRACVDSPGAPLHAAIGPPRCALNTKSALGEVPATPLRTGVALVRIMAAVTGAKLRGKQRSTPFFDAAGAPVRAPRQLTQAERAQVTPQR